MKAVIDRVVQYPNRFKLTDVSTGAVLGTFDLDAVTGAVSVVGTKINKELFDSIASDIEARVKTSGGDVSQTSETFTASSVRNNLTSGETISVSMGKIYKWLNDLKALAFKDSLGKADVGLGNIDNTTDKDKPISTATQTALDKKQDTLVSGTNIKTINSTSILGSGDITIASTSYTAGDNITITTDNKINANCVPLGTVYGTGAGNLAGGTGSVAGTSGKNYTNMTAYGSHRKLLDSQWKQLNSHRKQLNSQRIRLDSQRKRLNSKWKLLHSQRIRLNSQRKRLNSQRIRLNSQRKRLNSDRVFVFIKQ
jgi:hypothetical protein